MGSSETIVAYIFASRGSQSVKMRCLQITLSFNENAAKTAAVDQERPGKSASQ